jgi:hypothetical protein
MLTLSPIRPATYTSTNLNINGSPWLRCLPSPRGEPRRLAGLAGAAILADPLFAGNARAFHL